LGRQWSIDRHKPPTLSNPHFHLSHGATNPNRSTLLDSWTFDQLRTMKVGGNGNATAFFSQYASAGGHAKDVKAKYSSKAANLYKDRLRKLVEEDAKKYEAELFHDVI